jgi:hypothetical protein
MQESDSSRSTTSGAHQTTGTRRTQMRVMQRKSVGIVAVYEQDPNATDAGTRTLVFESPHTCVRVQDFPAEWQRLSDEELAAIRRAAS